MSYQAIETSRFGFYGLYKEIVFFINTGVSILDRREGKNIMANVFQHRYDLYKKRKQTMLLLNNSFLENIIRFSDIVLLLYKQMNKRIEFSCLCFGLTIMG